MIIIQRKYESVRICVDYRKLHEVTVADAESIPSADKLITLLSSSIFSKLNKTKGYYQVPISDESKHLAAFSTPKRFHEFNYMPFGLINASAMFARMTRALLHDIKQHSHILMKCISLPKILIIICNHG